MRGLDPRIHHSSQRVFRRGWIAGSSPAMTRPCFPGAMQREALAERCFAEPGSHQTPAFCTAPALQPTASQLLRAALRPGNEAGKRVESKNLQAYVFCKVVC